ncbi:stage III sporulation protein AG [Pelosinus propionicus DSM 13327]|uniref:Stage III sporulation protein AG n=2 Tax=Pelosinus TaxID=365348 RepID=A0A1I4KRE4_9FIRM|nr:stage III sporulation protein AG [Pelosinus propionicus DSM 13327]
MSGMESFLTYAKKIWPQQLLKDGVINTRLIWLGLLGIILLVMGGVIDRQTVSPSPKVSNEPLKVAVPVNLSYEEAIEGKLTHTLSQVKGAGTVVVNITWENSSTQEHARNITKESKIIQEKDTAGGVRSTTETKESTQILVSKENNMDHPVLVKEIKPMIKGVLVIADGAYDSNIKAVLTKAVEAGLGIPSYKITVLAQKK